MSTCTSIPRPPVGIVESKSEVTTSDVSIQTDEYQGYEGYSAGNGTGVLIVWFIIIFVVVMFALYAIKPNKLTNDGCGTINTGMVLLTALIISLIIILIVYAVRRVSCH